MHSCGTARLVIKGTEISRCTGETACLFRLSTRPTTSDPLSRPRNRRYLHETRKYVRLIFRFRWSERALGSVACKSSEGRTKIVFARGNAGSSGWDVCSRGCLTIYTSIGHEFFSDKRQSNVTVRIPMALQFFVLSLKLTSHCKYNGLHLINSVFHFLNLLSPADL